MAEDHPEGGEQLQHIVKMLEDRLNYGLFLDQYTTILLLDTCLDRGRLLEGARVASHLMLQVRETIYEVTAVMSRLHCRRRPEPGLGQLWPTSQRGDTSRSVSLSSNSAVFTSSVTVSCREAETCRGILRARSL